MASMSIDIKERIDIESWSLSANRNIKSDFLEHKIQKMGVAKIFLNKIRKYEDIFESAQTIVELGGGSCWASHIVKKMYPDSVVVGTDIAESAIATRTIWEPIFNTQLDAAHACRSYELPFDDQSIDLVFCFEAAHHFGKQYETLSELKRVLKPNGIALYLYEPGCPPYIYPLAYKRVNSLRESIQEDLLIYQKITKMSEAVGFTPKIIFDPINEMRGPKQTIYYAMLGAFPWLQRLLPSCIDVQLQNISTS